VLSGSPDPKVKPRGEKRTRRIVDRVPILRKLLSDRECRLCGRPAGSGHHLIKRSHGGDDVADNVIPLCGSGTTGCHGKVEDWDPNARLALGARLTDDEIRYVLTKLGRGGGEAFLFNQYRLMIASDFPIEGAS
jgi:5-methylcytosine-specific restriction endonuclease McrA